MVDGDQLMRPGWAPLHKDVACGWNPSILSAAGSSQCWHQHAEDATLGGHSFLHFWYRTWLTSADLG